MSQLAPHVQRMLDERSDLAAKINALSVFILGDFFKTLTEKQQDLLTRQLDAMSAYMAILGERIDNEMGAA
ncbi:hypothetical protein BEE12_16045 [Pantoea agglomerans]|uniref:crAss001_48 related protein n=1 Tax=Enterobacter agglomerans TaxID=549 RepID=UPI00083D29EE|nr:hypothetical protein [Pantoea agglomerans]AOE41230.1 hypothetical protein BEE12_16045 [Pantoea agglomerans]